MKTVRIEGKVTVDRVGDVFRLLNDAFAEGAEVHLDASGVGEADSAFLQLLAACCRTAEVRGGAFRVTGVSEPLVRTAEAAGFSLEAFAQGAEEGGDG